MFKRGRGKYNADYKSYDLYRFYKKKSKNPVPKSVYSKVLNEFFDNIMLDIITNNSEFVLPVRLGTLRIKSKPYEMKLDENGNLDKRSLMPDWGKTLKLWKEKFGDIDSEELKTIKNKPIIYHLNEHTNKTKLSWYWDKVTCNIPHQSYYKLDITRNWDRKLAQINKIKPVIYYE